MGQRYGINGAVLAMRRRRAKLSQSELAMRAQTTQAWLSMIESGRHRDIALRLACRLAKTLGCKVDDLVFPMHAEQKEPEL